MFQQATYAETEEQLKNLFEQACDNSIESNYFDPKKSKCIIGYSSSSFVVQSTPISQQYVSYGLKYVTSNPCNQLQSQNTNCMGTYYDLTSGSCMANSYIKIEYTSYYLPNYSYPGGSQVQNEYLINGLSLISMYDHGCSNNFHTRQFVRSLGTNKLTLEYQIYAPGGSTQAILYTMAMRVLFRCPSNCDSCDENGCTKCTAGYKDPPVNGECLLCNASCATCDSVNTDKCTSCANGEYINEQTFLCVKQCNQDGYYIDSTQKYCKKCMDKCLTCVDSTSCSSCKDNYYLQGSNCLECDSNCKTCKDNATNCQSCNQYYSLINTTCVKCDDSCQECSGTQIDQCTICRQSGYYIFVGSNSNNNKCVQNCDLTKNYYEDKSNSQQQYCRECLPFCKTCTNGTSCVDCIDGYYKNLNTNLCELCHETCQTCNGTSDKNCLTCKKDLFRQLGTNLCVKECDTSEFKNQQLQCQQCNSLCEKCDGPTSNDCLTCKTDTYLFNRTCVQICPNGYQIKPNALECEECLDIFKCKNCYETCQLCTQGQIQAQKCKTCYSETRELDSQNNCVCKNSLDKRDKDLFYHCSYLNIAVLNIYLSEIKPLLTIDFGSPIQEIVSSPDQLCHQIFEDVTINLLGIDCKCQISGNLLFVNLSNSSTVMENDKLILKKGVLQFSGQSVFIDTFYRNQVYQNPPGNPDLQFQTNFIENTCNPLIISLSELKNDAQRGFANFTWSLQSISGTQEEQLIKNINQTMIAASQIKNTTLYINPSVLPPDQNITIKFNYLLKVNKIGGQVFTITYKKEKIIRINYQQSIYPPIYRYTGISFFFQSYIESCEFGISTYFNEPTDLQIVSPQLSTIEQIIQNRKQSSFQLDIPPYTLPSNQTFTFNMILNLSSNDKIKTTKTISIDVQISKLFLSILGGSNFQFSYQQQFNLASKFRDYETQDQSDKGVTYSWDCKSLSSVDGICYNYKGDLLSIQQGISTVTLPERELKPYTAIVLTIQAQKEKRSTTFFATCLFTEFDIPALTVLQPLDQQNNKLNLNQDLYFTLQYNQAISSDTLSYAGALLYENRVVGTIKFDYYQVKFRIWNYYKDVNLASPMIQVRFSAYNPAYVMPSLSTINLSINIPPQNCIISVSPSSGEALKTIFTISYNSCTDEDLPLTYQFFYYNSDEDYQFEKNSPWNITRRQVADQTTNFMMSAILPQGSLVIMSQAMDSQLGISNKTQSVQVYGQNKTEEDYYQMVSQLIDYSQQNVKYENDQLVTLSIIGEDLTKNSQFQSQQINSLKGKLVTDLNAMSLQLPKFSLLSTFVNKVVAQLQQSLINSTQTQKSSIYNQLSYILKNVELSKANNNQTTLQQNNDILLQNLIDSFKILNSTVKQGSDQIDYQYYNNISLKIGNMLSNSTLPNEGSLLLQGNLSSLLSDTITQKNIYKYAIPLNQNEASNSTNILNIVSNTFEKNIYEETETFQNYVKQYENVTKNFEYSKNKLISMQINSSESNSSNISVIKYNFVNPIVSNKYNMTCLQQSEAEWSSKDCGILQVSNSQMCFCKAQKPTTIIESLDDMFLKNKNIDTVLSGQGLENISNFKDFYKYAIFWTLIAFTILEFILYLAGRSLDFKTRGRTSIQVFPQEQLNEQQIQNEQKQEYNNQLIAQPNLQLQNMENVIEQSPQSMPIQQEQQIESKRTVNLETEKQKSSLVSLKINPLSSNRIKRFRLRDKQNELKSLNCLSQNQLGDNSLKQSQQQDQIQTITTSSQDQMKDGQDSQDSQTQGNKDAIFNKLPYIKKIAIFHSFFSIFYLYDELISRPTKFTLFYIKCIHTIAISTLFSEYKNTVQLIAVALVNSIVMGVGSFLIQFTYKKGKIGKIISVFFQMVLSLIYLYIILAVSSGKSVGESNKFMLSFILSFFIDLVFVQVSTSNLMILLTKKHSYQTKYCFAKIYDILEIRQTIDALDA